MEKEIDDSIEVEVAYRIKKIVGYGATSVVYKAYLEEQDRKIRCACGEKQGKEVVAIKKVRNVFESEAHAHRILREIRLLRILRGHRNIANLKQIMRPSDPQNFNSLNLVFEYCTQNLMNLIKQNAHHMNTDHIKYLSFEIVKGVLYMHSKGVIHRDLKPQNIMVNENWEVKISHFGIANVRVGSINQNYNLTKSVTTRHYRAPEQFLIYSQNYDTSMDMWSIGCIIAELFTKKVFLKAKTTEEYLESLVVLLGLPD